MTVSGDFWDRVPDEYPAPLYSARARQVYWNKSFPACRAKGPSHAECLLNPRHEGTRHFGNGFDNYGPRGATWWDKREDRAQ
jgi:hypothetical protein